MTLDFNIHTIGYVEQGGGSISPSGTKAINENGVYDVTTYAKASVNVESTEPTLVTKTITPAATTQTIIPEEDTDGYSTITVEAVTANIDSDIQANNIKSGVEILGVTGTYEGIVPSGTTTITANGTYDVANFANADVNVSGGGSSDGIPREVVNGVYSYPTSPFTFKFPDGATKVGKAVCYTMFGCSDYGTNTSSTGLTSVDFNNIKILDQQACLYSAFYGCTNLTTIKADNLESLIANYVLGYAFKYCTSLETVRFPKLYTTGTNIAQLTGAFAYCTNLKNIYFPALTTSSNGCWTNMLQGVTGCTVHFPSAMQSTMSSWQVVTNGFSGTNTTVLFDL